MQTLNVQFASANTASEKSAANKKSQKSSVSFESVLKNVSESGKSKKTDFVQPEDKLSAKKIPENSEGKKVSKKDAPKKAAVEPADSRKIAPQAASEPASVSDENAAVAQGAFASADAATREVAEAEENTIEVVFDLTASESASSDEASAQAGFALDSSSLKLSGTQEDDGDSSQTVASLSLSDEAALKDGAELETEHNAAVEPAIEESVAALQGEGAEKEANAASALKTPGAKDGGQGQKEEAKASKETRPLQAGGPSNAVFTIVDERTAVQNASDETVELKDDSLKAVSAKDEGAQALNADAVRVQAQQNILSTNNQSAGATGSTFQAMLSQQIQENAPEFVKAGSIVLRDNNSGTINMTMRPESLGNVKISLELSDKVIAGQITVHSQEAYDAFKQNLDTLKQAFQQNGFDSAGFTLNLAQSGSGGASFGQEQHQVAQEFMSNRTYGELASSGESSAQEAGTAQAYSKSSGYQIDVVA